MTNVAWNREANYHEFTELPAWTRAMWDKTKLMNEPDPYKWSGDNPPPAIGTKVKVYMNQFGDGTVTGYFAEYGWMGVLVKIKKPPAWWVKQCKGNGENPNRPGHFFGIDLQPRTIKADVTA